MAIQPGVQFTCMNKPEKARAPLPALISFNVKGKKTLSDLNISVACFRSCSVDPPKTSASGRGQLHCT